MKTPIHHLFGSNRSHSKTGTGRDCHSTHREALQGLGHLQKAISLSTSEHRPWQQPTGRLRKNQLTKIPNQLVTSDVRKAGYPFGYVVSTCVLNSVSAWVPSFFDTDLSKMTTATTLGGKVCCSCSLMCVGCRTQKQRKVPPTKNNINKINKIVDLQDSIRIPFLPLFCLFVPELQ